ncbi:GNAT family N-acetyltransferase [Glycomyces buryatensis]|uniref:GNAT family N-acetyltransferase n=1 Tax=Glycomyces buryatensis TaxID=2570927 RepID=A0A4S8QBG3_9ACTN|nr:GNAT family N-acetyltransferase [Glycomyces buryatensis]THV40155.1 GNAT family N-acetyltransferase [Glycomyces buryatensis]
MSTHDEPVSIRQGTPADADRVYEIFAAARAGMRYLPQLYTDDQVQWWVREVMVPRSELWIAELDGRAVGFAALQQDWLHHLYVDPAAQGRGAGTALVEQVKRCRPHELNLHVFEPNTGARRLYERHGFVSVSIRDGSQNEEGVPDAHYRWRPASGTVLTRLSAWVLRRNTR